LRLSGSKFANPRSGSNRRHGGRKEQDEHSQSSRSAAATTTESLYSPRPPVPAAGLAEEAARFRSKRQDRPLRLPDPPTAPPEDEDSAPMAPPEDEMDESAPKHVVPAPMHAAVLPTWRQNLPETPEPAEMEPPETPEPADMEEEPPESPFASPVHRRRSVEGSDSRHLPPLRAPPPEAEDEEPPEDQPTSTSDEPEAAPSEALVGHRSQLPYFSPPCAAPPEEGDDGVVDDAPEVLSEEPSHAPPEGRSDAPGSEEAAPLSTAMDIEDVQWEPPLAAPTEDGPEPEDDLASHVDATADNEPAHAPAEIMPPLEDEAATAAATKIQSIRRGNLARQQQQQQPAPAVAQQQPPLEAASSALQQEDVRLEPPPSAPLEASEELEALADDAAELRAEEVNEPAHAPPEAGLSSAPSPEEVEAQELAAKKIQAHHRGKQVRRQMQSSGPSAAEETQQWEPPLSAPHEEPDTLDVEEDAGAAFTTSDEPADAPLEFPSSVEEVQQWEPPVSAPHEDALDVEDDAEAALTSSDEPADAPLEFPSSYEDDAVAAATRIQAIHRGNKAREQQKSQPKEVRLAIPLSAPPEEDETLAEEIEADQVLSDEPSEAPAETHFALSPEEEAAQAVAAKKIQAVHRGNSVRKHLREQEARLEPTIFAPSEDADDGTEADREEPAASASAADAEPSHAPPEFSIDYEEAAVAAATKIQAIQRGNMVRHHPKSPPAAQQDERLALPVHAPPEEPEEGGDLASDEPMSDEPAQAPAEPHTFDLSPEELAAQEVAAKKIQARHRGNHARRHLQQHAADKEDVLLEPMVSAPAEEEDGDGGEADDSALAMVSESEPANAPPEHEEVVDAATKIQAIYRGNMARKQQESTVVTAA